MARKVFISYRRDEPKYQARAVHTAFAEAITRENVFMDIDSIPPGANFRKILKQWVDRCDAMVWLLSEPFPELTRAFEVEAAPCGVRISPGSLTSLLECIDAQDDNIQVLTAVYIGTGESKIGKCRARSQGRHKVDGGDCRR